MPIAVEQQWETTVGPHVLLWNFLEASGKPAWETKLMGT